MLSSILKTVRREIPDSTRNLRTPDITPQFEGEVKAVSPNISYTVSGRKYTVENGENAVAFELRKNSAEGELVYFFNMFSYDIPAGVELGNAKLYAVTGRRETH